MNINVNGFRNYMFIYATRLCCLDIKTNDIMHALRWTVFESNNFNYVGKKQQLECILMGNIRVVSKRKSYHENKE